MNKYQIMMILSVVTSLLKDYKKLYRVNETFPDKNGISELIVKFKHKKDGYKKNYPKTLMGI